MVCGVKVFHHVLLKYGHNNAEIQKRKFDDVTLQYDIHLLWQLIPVHPFSHSAKHSPVNLSHAPAQLHLSVHPAPNVPTTHSVNYNKQKTEL